MSNGRKKIPLRKRKLEIAVYAVIAILRIAILVTVVVLINNAGKKPVDEIPSQEEHSVISAPDISEPEDSSGQKSSPDESSQTSSEESKVSESSKVTSAPLPSEAHSASSETSGKVDGDYISYTVSGAAEVNEWYLHLVNYNHSMPDSWRPTSLKTIDSEGRKIDAKVYTAYRDLVSAAKADGINLYPISAYRSFDTQNTLFQNRVNRALNENPSFSREEAENEAAKHVTRPNTSDHELGLAVDFISVETSFENTAAGKWLAKNSTDYGFVLRYPKDKQDITKITYEPWHFRFVGVKHAKKMLELGMCLEEYVDYLAAQG